LQNSNIKQHKIKAKTKTMQSLSEQKIVAEEEYAFIRQNLIQELEDQCQQPCSTIHIEYENNVIIIKKKPDCEEHFTDIDINFLEFQLPYIVQQLQVKEISFLEFFKTDKTKYSEVTDPISTNDDIIVEILCKLMTIGGILRFSIPGLSLSEDHKKQIEDKHNNVDFV
jgi:hypothetical protein